ncbi:MAG: hypothetical protein K2X44_09720 [Magnetospirillum sp.]|nr:hypothetical protein [Magnetospirillum sp.]
MGLVLPAEPTGTLINQAVMPAITDLGRRHPVTAALPSGAPWGSWLRQVAVNQHRGSAVLSGVDGRPLLILDKVGEGRVAQLLSDTIWLWARGFEGGGPHDELLRRLAHWLMKEPELEEESLTAEIKGDHLEILRHSLAPPPPRITITRPDGTTVQTLLDDRQDGRAVATVAVNQPGLWRVDDGNRTAIAAAGSLAPLENAELTATADLLAPVAEATGGSVRFLSEGGVPDLRRVGPDRVANGRNWAGLVARGEHTVTGLREIPLAPALVLLTLALGGLLLAWRREGR